MKNLFILMRQSLNNSLHVLKAGLIEMLQVGQNFLILAGIPVSILKKFRRCDAEVFADIEEDLHEQEIPRPVSAEPDRPIPGGGIVPDVRR